LAKVAIIGNQAFSLLNFRGLLIQAMVEQGHEVLALAPDYDSAQREKVLALGAKPIDFSLSRTGLNSIKDLFDFVRLLWLLGRLRPDVVLAYAIKPVIYGTLAAWLAGVPKRFALIEGIVLFLIGETGFLVPLKI